MILVTVGSILPFDELVRAVDEAVGEGRFGNDPVFFQRGPGKYIPVHGESAISLPNLRAMIREASFIICHGGLTLFECILYNKPFIAVPNPAVSDNHQFYFLRALGERLPIVWTENPEEVSRLVSVHQKSSIDMSQLEKPYLDVITFLSGAGKRRRFLSSRSTPGSRQTAIAPEGRRSKVGDGS